jgi:hypothetical protein
MYDHAWGFVDCGQEFILVEHIKWDLLRHGSRRGVVEGSHFNPVSTMQKIPCLWDYSADADALVVKQHFDV